MTRLHWVKLPLLGLAVIGASQFVQPAQAHHTVVHSITETVEGAAKASLEQSITPKTIPSNPLLSVTGAGAVVVLGLVAGLGSQVISQKHSG